MKRLEIIYEDNSCVVINKPAGLPVQGGKGVGISLAGILSGWSQRPFLVHRLDKDTSGIILVAKTREAAAAYSRLMGRGIKRYLAICKGRPDREEGDICLDLVIRGNVKKSQTHYRLLSSFGEGAFSLLELELGTGRMHQIRRHLALTGNPVLGDDKYGDFALNRRLRKTMKLKRLLLHASRLIIPETPDGLRLDITSPAPEIFRQFSANSSLFTSFSPD